MSFAVSRLLDNFEGMARGPKFDNGREPIVQMSGEPETRIAVVTIPE
jgi:hypothetical protein